MTTAYATGISAGPSRGLLRVSGKEGQDAGRAGRGAGDNATRCKLAILHDYAGAGCGWRRTSLPDSACLTSSPKDDVAAGLPFAYPFGALFL